MKGLTARTGARLASFVCGWLLLCTDRSTASRVELILFDGGGNSPLPCRVHLEDTSGRPIKPTALPWWRDHFVCDGRAVLELAPGAYRYAIERGPEYSSLSGRFEVSDTPLRMTNRLARLVDLAREGWWCGDTHVHRSLQDIELLMRAEDLHVAGVQTWWNKTNPWRTTALPSQSIVRFEGTRFYDLMSGEDERGGGALLYFGLKEPLLIAGAKREFPSAVKFLKEARKREQVWVDVEKHSGGTRPWGWPADWWTPWALRTTTCIAAVCWRTKPGAAAVTARNILARLAMGFGRKTSTTMR